MLVCVIVIVLPENLFACSLLKCNCSILLLISLFVAQHFVCMEGNIFLAMCAEPVAAFVVLLIMFAQIATMCENTKQRIAVVFLVICIVTFIGG